MALLEVVLVVGVLFAVTAVAAGRGGVMAEMPVDRRDPGLPDGRIEATDVDRLHFAMAPRGYRMGEVDGVLDQLSTALRARDAEIAALRAERDAIDRPSAD